METEFCRFSNFQKKSPLTKGRFVCALHKYCEVYGASLLKEYYIFVA